MALKLIPLNPAWTGSDTKLDIRGIYKRKNGDLTVGLPLRRHNSWVAKGLEFVTLADAESFQAVIGSLRASGHDPQSFVAGIDGDGRYTPWIVEKYLEDTKQTQAAADAELVALIAEYGVETVERLRGMKVPEHLRGRVPLTSTVVEEPASDTPVVRRGRPKKVTEPATA